MRQVRRPLAAQNYTSSALHYIKGRPQNGFILTQNYRAWSGQENRTQTRQHAEFPPHVMRGLDPIAKRWAPKHPLFRTRTKKIREIRMTVRKLKNRQFPGKIMDTISQKRCESASVDFFPLADGTGFCVAR